MARKRKRTRPNHAIEGDQKRQKIAGDPSTKDAVVKQAVLAQFYPQVLSLREYLLSKLPANSKIRRKKILLVGKKPDAGDADRKLSSFLDATLVGVSKCKELPLEERWKQWTTFSQRPEDSTVSADRSGLGAYSQSEVGILLLCFCALECCSSGSKIN
jgi:telomerase reverse transcriptase